MPTERLPRTIVLSDLHLGRPGGAGRAAAFEALAGDCDRLIVNGDAAELHHESFRAAAERELDALRDLCVTRGVRIDFIAGNHDPFVSELRALELADGAVYITHGDALHPALAPWSPYAASMRRAFEAAMRAAPPDMPEDQARFAAAREAALAEWATMGAGAHVSTLANMAVRPHRALRALAFWGVYPRLVEDWAARFAPRAGTIVVGHSHRPFIRTRGARALVNTGAYGFPGKPLAVVLEDGIVRVHAVQARGRHYRLASDAAASWSIAHARDYDSGEASTSRMKRPASASASRSSDVS
jgi:predicted phosphodiesterase